MDLTDLRMIAVIGGRRVSGAAEKMGYVQSNVTARIRKLESELGFLCSIGILKEFPQRRGARSLSICQGDSRHG